MLVALAAGGGYWVKSPQQARSGCAGVDDPVAAVKDADAAWAKAAAAHDVSGALSYYAGDAVVLPAHDQMLTNRPDMQKSWTTLLDKDNTVTWKPVYIEASRQAISCTWLDVFADRKVAKGK